MMGSICGECGHTITFQKYDHVPIIDRVMNIRHRSVCNNNYNDWISLTSFMYLIYIYISVDTHNIYYSWTAWLVKRVHII